ncbi:adenylate isopentenyltransferase-like [Macadamia integrifolia]|uniref:adenylate isopentenyltransferase-like n=1 Tax=Macadamia integrifolia TaxID=60698 RepID=UPI001C4ED030|nr:adenylate isopentenyltransferase-like [Macadamia integrifolia]
MRLLPLSSGYYCNNRAQSSLDLLQAILPFQTKFVRRPTRWVRKDSTITTTTTTRCHHRSSKDNKKKLVVILGATGTGKSRLSIDLATRLPLPCEVINSDKMQVYKGLDITTNKIPMLDRRGVPHHLLGFFDAHREFSATDYRSLAASTISSISERSRLPLLVGGSNSFIQALLAERFNPDSESGVSNGLRYNCCFLWVDLSFNVLCDYLKVRVDDMLAIGMIEELAEFYDPDKADSEVGIRKAIGIPELDRYFRRFPPRRRRRTDLEEDVQKEKEERKRALEEAVQEIKENTCELAKIQMEKIVRLRSAGWDLRKLDATEAFRAVMAKDTEKWAEVWEKDVVGPCVKIVKHFLEE